VLLEDGKLVPKHVGDTSLIFIYTRIYTYYYKFGWCSNWVLSPKRARNGQL